MVLRVFCDYVIGRFADKLNPLRLELILYGSNLFVSERLSLMTVRLRSQLLLSSLLRGLAPFSFSEGGCFLICGEINCTSGWENYVAICRKL